MADDIGFDGAGQASTDPAAILQGGAIRPFDRCLRCCRDALCSYILVAPDRALCRQALFCAKKVSRMLARKQKTVYRLAGELQGIFPQVLQAQLYEPSADPHQASRLARQCAVRLLQVSQG